ncbi:MAG TPA: RecX family transcriptional regulator [Gaiellaceae bacterium]|nr:RecX family transcriptional regulator [Gaiellaceae bacterium]
MATVTALRERPRGRVDVELDGAPWRTLPADAVVRSGLLVGCALDRPAARTLARELRLSSALFRATRTLEHRDRSQAAVRRRLAAAGVPGQAAEDAIGALERSGILDDARAAAARAQGLAGRGYGDAAVRFTLEEEGFGGEPLEAALAGLAPEAERARALLAAGRSARWLAARGFEVASDT